jgi:hypothetical protein
MINSMKSYIQEGFDVVMRMDTGHSPFSSQPEALGEILIRQGDMKKDLPL